ncbi:MAG: shikimate dehydrogenase [Bacteroidetes bacterium]|nr:shikimate dehydrogenase [Bacteroidota bacterium]
MENHIFALIGKSLTHSFSPVYYNSYFSYHGMDDYIYKTIEIDHIEEIISILKSNPKIEGFNVTLPYKEAIIPFLDKISRTAKIIGSVNVVKVVRENGQFELHGYNTDYKGFESMFKVLKNRNIENKKSIILGSGGVSRSVQYVLQKQGVPFLVISRIKKDQCISYEELTREIVMNHKVIINCTPLGMFPNIQEKPPINYDFIGSGHFLMDLIYNPEQTQFMKEGLYRASKVMNGMQMFMIQAKESLKIFL